MFEAAVFCLALNLYHEARGESVEGQRAVAYVTMNRAGWKQSAVCDTVFAPNQFSWANGAVEKTRRGWGIDVSLKPKERAAWTRAQNLAKTVLMVGRPVERFEALFYHADYVRPAWARKFTRVATIGVHHFYR